MEFCLSPCIFQTTNVSPLRGEKPQNRILSKLNTGRFALRAMLPVKIGLVLDTYCGFRSRSLEIAPFDRAHTSSY